MPDKISNQQMAADYGFALAFMNSDPELKRLFKTAVKKTWDVNMFTARLRATKWFRKNSASVRNAIMQETSDPATYRQNVRKMRAQVQDVWGKAYGGGTIGAKQINAWAETAYRMGWSEEILLNQMGAAVNFQKLLKSKSLGGTAAETSQQMDQLISQYGLRLGDSWKAGQLRRVMLGNDTTAGIQDRVKDMAKQQYRAFADQIDAGRTVEELADPYRQRMADLLEINPNDVSVRDRHIYGAMTAKDPKTGQATAQDINDFADQIRRDRRWQYTNNAKEQVANVTSNLLRNFGLV